MKKDQKKGNNSIPKSNVVDEIEKMKQKREERRTKMEEIKKEKADKEAEYAQGKNSDVDYELMIAKARFTQHMLSDHQTSMQTKLTVCVRKRIIFKKEITAGIIDAVSAANPQIKVHEPKIKVDGITKFVENSTFTFDNTFNENESTQDVYSFTLKPILDFMFNQGVVTCFAYGQTGSGKTYTMKGMEQFIIEDLYAKNNDKYNIFISCFEIYGGKCFDLLNGKQELFIMEDKNNNIQVQGLVEKNAQKQENMFELIEYANSVRTTHATVANDTSSRSHSICTVYLRDQQTNKELGKLILVDLAGSERAQDTQSNNRQRRMEGAEINKSLLALKECIRAMDDNAVHVPFRASKLTLVLRDSFIQKNNKSKIIMIACVSPGGNSADHTLNTLRYADRLKDKSNSNQQVLDQKPLQQKKEEKKEEKIEKKEVIIEKKEVLIQKVKTEQEQKNPNQQQPVQKDMKINVNQQQHEKIQRVNSGQTPKVNPPQQQQQIQQPQKQERPPQRQVAPQSAKSSNQGQNQNQVQNQQQKLDLNESFEDDQIELNKKRQTIKEDMKCMKETMKKDEKNHNVNAEFFDFHEKVSTILEETDELFLIHMAAIKEDAKILTTESELVQSIQKVGIMDYDIDHYVAKLESIIRKKLKMYNYLKNKMLIFKCHLEEEEQISQKVKDTYYY